MIQDNIKLCQDHDAVDTVVEAVDTIFVIKGKDVALAKGEYSNLKITTVTDLKIAKSMIEKD